MRKIGRNTLAAALIAIASVSVVAQEKLVLTLEDSVRLALEQNPMHLATGQRVEAARSILREAASGFFPSLALQGLSTLDEKLFSLEFPSFIPGQPPTPTVGRPAARHADHPPSSIRTSSRPAARSSHHARAAACAFQSS